MVYLKIYIDISRKDRVVSLPEYIYESLFALKY